MSKNQPFINFIPDSGGIKIIHNLTENELQIVLDNVKLDDYFCSDTLLSEWITQRCKDYHASIL